MNKRKYWMETILEIEDFKMHVKNAKLILEAQKDAEYIGLSKKDMRIIMVCMEIALKESDCQIEYAVKEMNKEEK